MKTYWCGYKVLVLLRPGGNQDFVIAGNTNNVNSRCEVIGCINNWDIDGNTNDIDVTQIGTDDKSITFDLTGDGNNIDIDQTTSASGVTDTIAITAVSSSGTINLDQCTSGC